MNGRKWFRRIGIGLLGLVGIASLAAFRGGPGGMHGHGPEGFFGARLEGMLDEVDATPQQREQIRAITDRLREQGKALREDRADRRAEREQLIAQWEAGNLDRAQLARHLDARADKMKAFGQEVATAMVEVQGILTPEQRAKVAEKMRRQGEGRERRGEGRGRRGPASGS